MTEFEFTRSDGKTVTVEAENAFEAISRVEMTGAVKMEANNE